MRLIDSKHMFKGLAGDSFLLMFVRMVTLVLGLLTTRVLSGHFSLQEYGDYSQIMLLVTTISSMTMLGMMDGINYFFCKEYEEDKRNAYVSTIFFLQYIASLVASIIVLVFATPISNYFSNENLKSLVIFAAILPAMNNTISLLQIMFIAIGKSRLIAVKNLSVSVFKLLAVILSCYVFDNILVILLCQVLTDVLQVLYFTIVLHKNNCYINVCKFKLSLVKEILAYCMPMAMFSIVKTLNRDSDKYVISFFTNAETLAIYTNASKLLPFDIVMISFCTVLLPYITRYISLKKYEASQQLYRAFLEISYISTSILAIGAICVSPELMRFLYTEKYSTSKFGIIVFIMYILVDIISVTTITMILSAAGKTRTIMFASLVPLVLNIILNILLYYSLGEIGPAIATLVVTILQGVLMLSLGANAIKTNMFKMYDLKYLVTFIIQLLICSLLAIFLRKLLLNYQLHYIVILFTVFSSFVALLFLINFRRLLKNLRTINECKTEC